ncbi:uncharacterized protein F5147DRAFT_705423 [Suillus discolor]|uniref:Uncharacterized protein n=1 Tax=Suillus discolor TaxID=1912936 RepID=A0A9P7F3T4_9AGAM|nr:uncharacterized protein F5147DRAFT_705423 [Suillus discolor]KAG2103765.1 hypothetical protein F5147DRAFT_705423 [Suillus discolor]
MLLHRISALFVVPRALQMPRCFPIPMALMLIFCRSRSLTVAVAVLALEFQCRSILVITRSVQIYNGRGQSYAMTSVDW